RRQTSAAVQLFVFPTSQSNPLRVAACSLACSACCSLCPSRFAVGWISAGRDSIARSLCCCELLGSWTGRPHARLSGAGGRSLRIWRPDAGRGGVVCGGSVPWLGGGGPGRGRGGGLPLGGTGGRSAAGGRWFAGMPATVAGTADGGKAAV